MKKVSFILPWMLLLLSFSLTMVQCKKEDKPKTRAELLLGNWSVTGDTYDPAYDYLGNGQAVTDAYALYTACEKDNIYIFKASNAGELNEGTAKCDPSDPQSIPFTYLLKSGDSVLNLSVSIQGSTFGQDFNILQLDGTTLKLKYSFDDGGTIYTNTQTYTRK